MEYGKLLAPLDHLKTWMKHMIVKCRTAHHALLKLKNEKFWKQVDLAPGRCNSIIYLINVDP